MQQKHRSQRCCESHRCGQSDGPSLHTSQPCCAVHKYSRILCAHLHTELAALCCSTPYFLLPDFLQPDFTSSVLTPQILDYPSVAFQSSWAELGLWGHAALLSLGSLAAGLEFLLKDGELAFSQHRSRGTSLTQTLKSWLLYFSTFLFFFIFFFPTEVILSSWQLIHVWIFTEAVIFLFSWLKEQKCCPVICLALLKQTCLAPAGITHSYNIWLKVWQKRMSLSELGISWAKVTLNPVSCTMSLRGMLIANVNRGWIQGFGAFGTAAAWISASIWRQTGF